VFACIGNNPYSYVACVHRNTNSKKYPNHVQLAKVQQIIMTCVCVCVCVICLLAIGKSRSVESASQIHRLSVLSRRVSCSPVTSPWINNVSHHAESRSRMLKCGFTQFRDILAPLCDNGKLRTSSQP
jgi:hypothetical protein